MSRASQTLANLGGLGKVPMMPGIGGEEEDAEKGLVHSTRLRDSLSGFTAFDLLVLRRMAGSLTVTSSRLANP